MMRMKIDLFPKGCISKLLWSTLFSSQQSKYLCPALQPSSRVEVDLSPVDFLLVEEGWSLDSHEHVDSGKAHAEESKGDHDTNKAAWSDELLDVHVIHWEITEFGDFLGVNSRLSSLSLSRLSLGLSEGFHEKECEHEDVCGKGLCFHYIFN